MANFMTCPYILYIENDKVQRKNIIKILQKEHNVEEVETAEKALMHTLYGIPQLILSNICLAHTRNFSLLVRLKKVFPEVPIILLGSPALIKHSPDDLSIHYILEPSCAQNLCYVIDNALKLARLQQEKKFRLLEPSPHTDFLWSCSLAMKPIKKKCLEGTNNIHNAFIDGEPGSGKETLARWLHTHTHATRKGRFVKICASSFTEQNFEYKLFGIAHPSFGLEARGLLHEALGGTLYVEHLEKMLPPVQKMFSLLLQKNYFSLLGKKIALHMRIIGSANCSATHLKEREKFSPSVIDRLKLIHLSLPPLNKRPEDIEALARWCYKSWAQQSTNVPAQKLSPGFIAMLKTRLWKRNIDELKAFLYLAYLSPDTEQLCVPEKISSRTHKETDRGAYLQYSFKKARLLFEADFLHAHVLHNGGNIKKTAQTLGIERSTLHRKLKFFKEEGVPSK